MKRLLTPWGAVLLLGLAPSFCIAVVPGAVSVDATFEHIGVRWDITGDADLDSSMTLEFRLQGQSAFKPGAPAVRAYPTLVVDGAPLGLDYWGASAMFLEPGQDYELRLTLADPDGGGETRTVNASTRSEPRPGRTGRQLFVTPGTSGGDGSLANPFRGIKTATDAAQPGDILLIGSGTYGPFELLKGGTPEHPFSLIGPGDDSAIVDGGGTDRGVVTIGDFLVPPGSDGYGHIIIEGLTIQNGAWGVDAQNTHDLSISRNKFRDVSNGVINRRGQGLEKNQTVCDNIIEGRTAWPGAGIPETEGVDLRGDGNVVCHNRIRLFGDCISVYPISGASNGNDVFGNDVSECVDDGIEIDYNQSNVRVWRNRVMNARMGVSVQPISGGPAYILRNEMFNIDDSPIKMHNDTTGFWVAHNTSVKRGNGHGDNGAMWRNAVFRNNLFLGTEYAFEFTTVPDEGFRDFDYNAWGTTRSSATAPQFKWDDMRFLTLTDLKLEGIEVHAVAAQFTHLTNATLNADYSEIVKPGTRDLRLVPLVAERDGGAVLSNFNDPFVTDGMPDMGVFEAGQPTPIYGPRPVPTLIPASDGLARLVLLFLALACACCVLRSRLAR